MSLYSIPPHERFLATLAERVMDGTLLGGWDRANNPFWLSDVTMVVPTRRAKQVLADEFARHIDGFSIGLLSDR